MLEPWVAWSVHFPTIPPSLSMYEYGAMGSASCCTACPIHSTIRHLAESASRHLASSPLHPSCPSPPLLQVWMNVSSLSPWLLDFRAVLFFGQFWLLFVFKSLSFFWLCEESQCVSLRLHLGRKLLEVSDDQTLVDTPKPTQAFQLIYPIWWTCTRLYHGS